MRTIIFISLLFSSHYALAFPMLNSTGIDLQSTELMMACQDTVERAAMAYERKHDINLCSSGTKRITPNSTKITGLALEKKGFVYTTDVESTCGTTVRLEVEVGPAANGKSCPLFSNPVVIETLN